jgi:2-methylfumaryl-CoA isomerase
VQGLLTGMRVIEGSAFVAAPLGGMTLAQLGADVIRFDPIGGGLDAHRWPVTHDNVSLFWAGLNKGKRSLAIDIRSARGREILAELVTEPGPDTGFFLTNLPARGPLAYDKLRARRDDLVMVSITGNYDGSTAVDYTVNPATGFPWATGPENLSVPFNHLLPAWDAITGTLAAAALLAADRFRSRTGQGQQARIALSDVAFAMVANLGKVAEVQINKSERPKYGNYLYGAFGRDFSTRDGHRIMVVALTDNQWRALRDATGLAEGFDSVEHLLGLDFRKEGDRFEARELIGALVKTWLLARPLQEVRGIFDEHNVCWGPYNTFREMVETDPRCSLDNPMWQYVDQPGIGTYLMPGSPVLSNVLGRLPPSPAPVLGQHTDEILADVLGLDAAEIGRLHDEGVVASPGDTLLTAS